MVMTIERTAEYVILCTKHVTVAHVHCTFKRLFRARRVLHHRAFCDAAVSLRTGSAVYHEGGDGRHGKA
jgi:hypothetical protein